MHLSFPHCCNLKREARSLATVLAVVIETRDSGCNLKREARSLATSVELDPLYGTSCCNLKREARSLATASRRLIEDEWFQLQSQTRSPFPRYTHERITGQHIHRSCNLKREARSLATREVLDEGILD